MNQRPLVLDWLLHKPLGGKRNGAVLMKVWSRLEGAPGVRGSREMTALGNCLAAARRAIRLFLQARAASAVGPVSGAGVG